MRGVIFISLVLWQSFCMLWGSLWAEDPPHGAPTWCLPSSGACYSVHLARLTFQKAQAACAEDGGGLSTASGNPEVRAILTLLDGVANGSGDSLFWLGLVRKAQQCTLEDLPLRGFSWALSGFQEATMRNETMGETLLWLREPSKTCTKQRCAGLQVTLGRPLLEPWGLREHACTKASLGYICKYHYDGFCPTLHLQSGATSLHYTLPYRLQSMAVAFSPPGTELTLRCTDGQDERFTCRLSSDGYHWESAEPRKLCSCPSGYWSPGKAVCMESTDCLDSQGTFLCLCSWGSRLGADEKACIRPAEDGGTEQKVTLPSASATFSPKSTSWPWPNNSMEEPFPSGEGNNITSGEAEKAGSPNSFNYVYILITVAVVMLVMLIMAALQVFQVCFRKCSSKGSQHPNKGEGAPDAATIKDDPEASPPHTDSEHSFGPCRAESVEALQDNLEPVNGQGEVEEP